MSENGPKNVKMSEKGLESKCLVTYADFDKLFSNSKFPNFFKHFELFSSLGISDILHPFSDIFSPSEQKKTDIFTYI